MTDSDTSPVGGQAPNRQPLFPGLTRYDLVLAFMPTVFIVAILASYLLAVPLRVALVGASLVGIASLVDALFRNPPRQTGGR